MLSIDNIYKSFGKYHILRGLSLEAPEGKITVILGGSGQGKSVLMKHLIGLLKPDSGKISVAGQDITIMNEYQLNDVRAFFGMVFQQAALFDSMNVIDNVMFPIIERRHRLHSHQQAYALAQEMLHTLGLHNVEEKFPAELSGGMRKRVALARALIKNPKIILYDEPTTGLDPLATENVNEMIQFTNTTYGVTSFVISHDIISAFSIAHKIAILYEGQILEAGSPDEIRKSKHPYIQQFLQAGLHGTV